MVQLTFHCHNNILPHNWSYHNFTAEKLHDSVKVFQKSWGTKVLKKSLLKYIDNCILFQDAKKKFYKKSSFWCTKDWLWSACSAMRPQGFLVITNLFNIKSVVSSTREREGGWQYLFFLYCLLVNFFKKVLFWIFLLLFFDINWCQIIINMLAFLVPGYVVFIKRTPCVCNWEYHKWIKFLIDSLFYH